MVDRQYRDELLDASFEAVRLELENTEKDLEKLEKRAEKLRAARKALSELVQDSGDNTPSFLKSASSRGLQQSPRDAVPFASEAARATA
jgi:hypothetical protein